jgi:hypothetical protein
MVKFSKFSRPAAARAGRISDRDLDLIEVVLRYRFSPTSELVRLVGGNEDVTQRRLRMLWERGLLNRFAFPGIRSHSEFIYYLDNRQTLEVLVSHGRLSEIHQQMEDEARMNREADYAAASFGGQHMKLGFLHHSLVISRMHFMLEMAARGGQFELQQWRQGAELRGNKVNVPEIWSRRQEGSNDYVWEELQKTVRLPVEPDALFTLRFPDRTADQQLFHFCYEADRGSMPVADMLKKFRAYYHFIKRQQLHKDAFGVHPMRAVLVETTDEARARKLMETAQHPAVIGSGKRTALFWFVISPLFTDSAEDTTLPSYLIRPEMVVDSVWALPDAAMRGLGDAENSPSHALVGRQRG